MPQLYETAERSALDLPDGRRLSYLVWNRAAERTMLLLHGGTACAADWWPVAEAFEGEWRVVAPDQRGCGHSDWDPELRYGIEPLLEDLGVLAQALRLAGVVLVGHSLGAAAACLLAAQRPDLVRALVLEDGGPREGSPRPRVFEHEIPTAFASREEARAFLAATGLGGRGRAAWVLDTRLRTFPDGQLGWHADMAGHARWAAAGGEPRILTLWDEVARLRCPTLVVRGEESPLFPREVPVRMTELNPLVRWVEISGAGHGIHYEQPEAFVSALREFVAGL